MSRADLASVVVALALVAGGCGSRRPPAAPVPDGRAVTEVAEDATPAEGDPSAPAPAPSGPTRADTAQRIGDAVRLLERNQPRAAERAVGILEEVLATDRGDAYAHLNLGVAHHQLGRRDQAKAAFDRAAAIDGSLADAWLYLGALEEQAGNLTGALEQYRRGVRGAPDHLAIRVALIGALRAVGRPEEAIAEARRALAVDTSSLALYNNLGLAYLDLDNLDLAQFVFEKAMHSLPGAESNALVQANYGWTLYRRGDKSGALFHLKKAVELDRELVPALVYLARAYLDDRNYVDTVPLLERARAQQPRNHGVLVNLGIAYRGVGRHEDARRAYQEALEVRPDDPSPWFNLGILEADAFRDHQAAMKAFERYIAAGGREAEQARAYVAEVEKEIKRAEKLKKAEEDKKRREAEMAQQRKLLEQAEKERARQQRQGGGGWTEPGKDEPAEAPPPKPRREAPTEDESESGASGNPWGER